jgi:hypothetical protein
LPDAILEDIGSPPATMGDLRNHLRGHFKVNIRAPLIMVSFFREIPA